MRFTGLILLTSLGLLQAQATYQPVATSGQLMRALIIPSSDALFEGGGEAPTPEQWEKLEDHALILIESGNLLMMPGRGPAEETWMKESQALLDSGQAALKAVRAKDVDKLIAVGEQILAACSGCHDKYLKQ